ncbi:hypothetical protein N9D31_00790 [Oligoflexaceae bacterium]|nr:hypothetical protein [Oligoflexaceae bacterium]
MWRYLWLLLTYLIVTCIPLLTQIGRNFEYEYALFVSVLALITFPFLAVFFPKKYIPVFGPQFRPPVSFDIIWIFFVSPIIAVVPGFIAFASRACDCSYMSFYFWMFVQALPCWFFAHTLYYLVLKLRHEGLTAKKSAFLLICIYLLVSLTVGSVLWFFPQKRLVSVFIGFIHGPIYDNWIPVDGGIFFARLAHIGLAITLMTLIWYRRKRSYTIALSTLATISLGLFIYSATFPSVGNGTGVLRDNFTSSYKHGGLTMHYVEGVDKNINEKRIKRIFKDAVFNYEDLSEILGVQDAKVDVYLYPDQHSKKLWFGGGATDVADVVGPSIHITFSQWPHPTLRHELVHALASEFAFYGLGFHPNMALTEGLAVALAPNERSLTLDHASAALIKQGRLPNLENLFSLLFWKEAGRRAYTVSGSIIAFVVREYGFRAVRDLYSGKSWQKSLGEAKEVTLKKWREHVEKVSVGRSDDLLAERLYRYSGIVSDRCPHSKSDLAQSRDENIFNRLRQPIGWDPKSDYLLWRAKLDPENFSVRFSLWKSQIADEMERRIVRKGRLVTWAKTLENARKFPPETIEDIEAAILQSDIQTIIYGPERAANLLSELNASIADVNVGESLRRQIEVRIRLNSVLPAPENKLWTKYLAGWTAIPKQKSEREPWIVKYLRLRNGKGIERSSLMEWATSEIPEDTTQNFRFEWYKFLGHRQFQLQLYDQASSSYDQAQKYASDAEKDLLSLWTRKSRFFGEKKKSVN